MKETYEFSLNEWSRISVSSPQMAGTPLVIALDFAVKSAPVKESTRKTYERLVAGLDEQLLLTPIQELQYNHVRLAILRQQETDSPKRLHARYSLLKTCLRRIDKLELYALKDRRLIDRDFEVRRPKRPPTKQVGTEVIHEVLKEGGVWSYVFSLGCASGLRKSDIYATKWDQLRGRTFRALHGKTEKYVDLELGELGLMAFNGLRKLREGEYVVPLRNTRSWETCDRHYSAFLKPFGLTPHDSRRLFAQLLLEKGASVPIVQRLGCWSDVAMVMRYAASVTDREAARYRL